MDPSGYLVNPGFPPSTWYTIENLWYSTPSGENWNYTNQGGGQLSGRRITGYNESGYIYGGGVTGGYKYKSFISMPRIFGIFGQPGRPIGNDYTRSLVNLPEWSKRLRNTKVFYLNYTILGDYGSQPGEANVYIETDGLGYAQSGGDMINYIDFLEGFIGVTQIELMNHRQSLPIMNKIGNFSSFSKTYRFLGNTRSIIGGASTYVGTPLSIGLNVKSCWGTGEIGFGMFAYRTLGDLSSVAGGVYIGAQAGGPWGAAAGALITGSFWAGEQIYNGLKYSWNELFNFCQDFQDGLKTGWYPGK